MKIAAFDLESESIPDDWDRLTPLGITCASAKVVDDARHVAFSQTWWAGMASMDEIPVGLETLKERCRAATLPVRGKMTEEEVALMFSQLQALLRLADCRHVFVWNGAGFDWPLIAANLPDQRREVIDFALHRTFDPCFQAIRVYGFPIGLENVAMAMLGRGKTEGMDGERAATFWPFEKVPDVLQYVNDDAALVIDVVKAIMQKGEIRWIKQDGKEGMRLIDPPHNNDPRWMTVSALSKMTYRYGNRKKAFTEPNRSWMDKEGRERYELPAFLGWTKSNTR